MPLLAGAAILLGGAVIWAQFRGEEQILNKIFDSTNTALRLEAVANGGGGGSPAAFLGADQIFNKIYDSTNNALRINAVVGGVGYADVKAQFGAKGDGVTDDTTAIQNAINAAAPTQSVVFFPTGKYIASQLVWKNGVTLAGTGMARSGGSAGSVLQQKASTNLDFIVSDTALSTTQFQAGGMLTELTLLGDSSNTSGNGIQFNSRVGEGLLIRHVTVGGTGNPFAGSGISVTHGWGPLYWDDIHCFSNGAYGINLTAGGSDPTEMALLSMVSGDNNATALVHLGSGSGLNSSSGVTIIGVKAEKVTAGRQQDVIVIDNQSSGPVTIIGANVTNSSGETADAIVKLASSGVRLTWAGFNAPNTSPNNYTSFINDAVNFITFAGSAAVSGTYLPGGGFGSFNLLNLNAQRIKASYGTATVAGDYALSAGWGTTASVTVAAGSDDQRGQITVAATGTGQAANPTITFTFKDGAWTSSPFYIVKRNDANVLPNEGTAPTSWTQTTTVLTITFNGTPTAANSYVFAYHGIG